MTALDMVLHTTAESLGADLDSVFADLRVLDGAARDIFTQGDVARGMLEGLKPLVERIVEKQQGLIDSAGISVAPGLLTDAEMCHQWWSYLGGKLVYIPHNLNPASINFYDYTDMTWYAQPVASGRAELIGPYIDFGGADMKVITASRPVMQGERIAAVAGADLSMIHIERAFLRSLGRRSEHVALITETGKVVASNSARFAPGTRFGQGATGLQSVPVAVKDLASPSWRLIVAD